MVLLSVFGYRAYSEATSRPEYGYAYPLPDWWWRARLPGSIEHIDASDTAKLKSVLFGGEPWLLECYSGLPFAGQHLPRPYRVHPVFSEALVSMRGLVRAGIIDCETQLPSNKTVVAKLGLVRRTQPLLVLAYAGGAPKQLPAASTTSAYAITAFVKPKVEPTVLTIQTHKTFLSTCGGRRPCLLARMDQDSPVLEAIARAFRTIGVIALGDGDGITPLAWGRGDEIGETLDEEEARHLGKRFSIVLPDPEEIVERREAKKSGNKKAARRSANPSRLLRGFTGEEDVPSLSRFVEGALKDAGSTVLRAGTDAFMRIPLPALSSGKRKAAPAGAKSAKPKKGGSDNSEVQARRARERKEKLAKEAAAAAERAESEAKARGESEVEAQKRREAARREQMQRESELADNLIEEVSQEEEEQGAEEEEELEMEDLDLDD